MAPDHLLPTSEAARRVGVARRTLTLWASEGLVTPALRTAGGHYRWDLADLQRQLDEMIRDRPT